MFLHLSSWSCSHGVQWKNVESPWRPLNFVYLQLAGFQALYVLRSTITREKFEELCADLREQALNPIKDVLTHSGMKIGEIYAVELIGGATRVPKLQAKLHEFLGQSELDKHLDADEAIVLGASLHAANPSDGIKLNRKLGMIDGSTYGFVFEIDGPYYVKDESTFFNSKAGIWKCMLQYICWICEMVYGKNSEDKLIIWVRGKYTAMMMMAASSFS